MTKTIHIDPAKGDVKQKRAVIQETIDGLLDADKPFAVTVAEENAMFSPKRRPTGSASPASMSVG